MFEQQLPVSWLTIREIPLLINSFLALFRHRSQTSSTVYLRSNRVYYMEALMIDAGGPDHLSVGVRIPGRGYQRPISNRNLYVVPPGNPRTFLHY